MEDSFNPRPPLKVGATRHHFSPCFNPRCFNPRPPLKVGATRRVSNMSTSFLFQSSPTSKGGRYHWTNCTRQEISCFNPRPPLKVGATLDAKLAKVQQRVSILAHL